MSVVRNFRFLRINTALMQQVRGNKDSSSSHDTSGSIRAAGGAFGKREAAFEDEYFHRKQAEQLAKLKDGLHDEIQFHEEQIKRHQDAIKRHKERVHDIDEHKK